MTLTDPRDALADQSNFIGCLLGVAGLSRVVRTLAEGDRGSGPPRDPDDFVHVLLGLASLGGVIERLAKPPRAQLNPAIDEPSPAPPATRWLR
jgi:hypothetical protein